MTAMLVWVLAVLAQAPFPIGGQIPEPRKVKNVAPRYPEEAVRAGLQGVVRIECTIDKTGRVTSATVREGVPPLTEAALKAVQKWRYTPTLLNGAPVPVIMIVTVNFKRQMNFRLGELLDSLNSKNEFIRESAARWLGGARAPNVAPSEVADIVHRLARLAEQDEAERVRTVAAESVRRLEAR